MAGTRRLCILVVVALLSSFAPLAARADEPIIQNQLYNQDMMIEFTLTPTFSIFDKYTQHIGTALGVGIHFNDYIGIEAEFGYNFMAGDRKLLNDIVTASAATLDSRQIKKLPLSDLKYMPYWFSGGLVFDPLYGKISLTSELAISFHLYLVAGVGGADYRYHQLGTYDAGTQTFSKNEEDVGIKVNYYVGGGLRFHITGNWALRIEIRDQFFYDTYEAEMPAANPGNPPDPKTIKDFVHITTIRLGVCFAF